MACSTKIAEAPNDVLELTAHNQTATFGSSVAALSLVATVGLLRLCSAALLLTIV